MKGIVISIIFFVTIGVCAALISFLIISKLLLLILFKLLLLLILLGSSVNKTLALENCLETISLLSLDFNSKEILFVIALRDKISEPEWSAFEIIKFLLELNLFFKSLLRMIKGFFVLKFFNVMNTLVIFNFFDCFNLKSVNLFV